MTTLKTELRAEIEREIEVAKKIKERYWKEWEDAITDGDNVGAEVKSDLIRIEGGHIMAYERMLKWLDIYGGLYEDGEERALTLD